MVCFRRPTAKQSAKKKRQQEPETFECIDVLSGQHFQSTTSTSFPTSLSISQNQPEPTFTLPSETEASALVPPPHSLPPPPATVVSDDDPPSLSFTFPDVSSVSSPPFPAEQTQQQADEELFRQIQLLHEADASQKDNLNDWTAEKSADASFDLSQFVNLDVPPIDPDLFHEDGLEESSTSTTITTPVDLPDPEFNKFVSE